MPELTITSPNVNSRVDANTFTMDNPMPARVDFIPYSGTLDLASEEIHVEICSQNFLFIIILKTLKSRIGTLRLAQRREHTWKKSKTFFFSR